MKRAIGWIIVSLCAIVGIPCLIVMVMAEWGWKQCVRAERFWSEID